MLFDEKAMRSALRWMAQASLLAAVLSGPIGGAMLVAEEPIRFSEFLIQGGYRYAYGVTAADFDGDGRPDLLATAVGASNVPFPADPQQHLSRVVWYENPGRVVQPWTKHVIDEQCRAPVHGQPVDLDGDSDLIVVTAFGMRDELSPECPRSQGRERAVLSHAKTVFLSNLSPDARILKARLRLDRLGLKGRIVEAFNPLTDAPLALGADGKITVSLGSEEWRYVWLRPAVKR